MGQTYGDIFKIHIFGESHSRAMGVSIEGLPAGTVLDEEELFRFMNRRSPGRSDLTSQRKEDDRPIFISGLLGKKTCGTALTCIIKNTDTRSSDYDEIRDVPRPGHADYPAHIRYRGFEDVRGGGSFSGRLTAPLCVAGGIAIQVLTGKGVRIETEIEEIGGKREGLRETIEKAKSEGDSVGGIVKCTASGFPIGYGGPLFERADSKIASIVMAIPAVKAIEFGSGFSAARKRGGENNDPYAYCRNESGEDEIQILSNNAGGILGGITTGEDIVFRVGVKPTPSIGREQMSVSYSHKENVTLKVKGRHDPCIVLRIPPVIESACAIALLDLLMKGKCYD
jgi:chorismate synthase